MDYDASPLTEEEIMKARVTLTTIEINQLVDLGHHEADTICREFLHMVLPKRGIPLTPLSGPPRKTNSNSKIHRSEDSDTEEDDDEWEGDEEDNDAEAEEEILEVAKDSQDDEAAAAVDVARDAAQYSELCE